MFHVFQLQKFFKNVCSYINENNYSLKNLKKSMCGARCRIFTINFRLMSLICRKKLSIYHLSKNVTEFLKITVYLKHSVVTKKFRQKVKKSEIYLKQKPKVGTIKV